MMMIIIIIIVICIDLICLLKLSLILHLPSYFSKRFVHRSFRSIWGTVDDPYTSRSNIYLRELRKQPFRLDDLPNLNLLTVQSCRDLITPGSICVWCSIPQLEQKYVALSDHNSNPRSIRVQSTLSSFRFHNSQTKHTSGNVPGETAMVFSWLTLLTSLSAPAVSRLAAFRPDKRDHYIATRL
jgi:hypothetical protein